MQHLSIHFGVPVTCIHQILHECLKIMHAYLVPRYIHWHSMPKWRSLAGTFPEWPRVVAIVDRTPFRISKPTGTDEYNIAFMSLVVIISNLVFCH